MVKIDLHMHSAYSQDGEHTPQELARIAAREQIGVLALTDHNSVRGVKEMIAAGKAAGIRVIPAIELDCLFAGYEPHLIGYGIDPDLPAFAAVEAHVEAEERRIAAERLDLIAGLGMRVHRKALLAKMDGVVTGEDIAEDVLTNPENDGREDLLPYRPGGRRADNPLVNFYWDYCAVGKPAFVPMRYLSLAQAVDLVRRAGGVPVLAHPGQTFAGQETALLTRALALGIWGIEAYSSYHTPQVSRMLCDFAAEQGLIVTCGSDFHGKIKPAIHMGGHGAPQAGQLLRALETKIRLARTEQ